MYTAWKKGEVLVTLGTGKEAGKRLIPLHAYAVLGECSAKCHWEPKTDVEDVKEQDGERIFEVFDPGLPAEATSTALEDTVASMHLDAGEPSARRTGLFTMTWDEVCTEFDALNLNWNPSLRPVVAKRHWWVSATHFMYVALEVDSIGAGQNRIDQEAVQRVTLDIVYPYLPHRPEQRFGSCSHSTLSVKSGHSTILRSTSLRSILLGTQQRNCRAWR